MSKQQNRYIVDLNRLGNIGDFEFSYGEDAISINLQITLGYKNSPTDSWRSYASAISPRQLSMIDLYDTCFMGYVAADESLIGLHLPDGYFVNTKENWAICTEEINNLLSNLL